MAKADDGLGWKRFKKMRISSDQLNRRTESIEKGLVKHAHTFVTSRLDHLAEVRRDVIGWIILLMLLVGMSAMQWGLFRSAYTHDMPRDGGTYSEGVLGPLETLNPLFARSSAERSATRLLFSSLYNYDTSGKLKGDLAQSVSINPEETEYIVRLREQVRWSDGKPLTADDVIFTVETLKNPRVGASSDDWSAIQAKKISDREVAFILSAPYAPFMHTLTFPVIPKHILGEVEPAALRDHSFAQSPVGSGPFKFRLLQTDSDDGSRKVVHLTANELYYQGRARLERFQLHAYPSADELTKGLRTSEVIATPELVFASQPDNIQKMYQMNTYNTYNGVYALFNSKSPVLGSAAVRKALVHTIDREALRKQLPQATDTLTGSVLPEHIDGDLEGPAAYDVEAAKNILDAEGWKLTDSIRSKDGQRLKLSVVALQNSEFENIANYVADAWRRELNIEVEVRIVNPSDATQDVLRSVLQPRNFDVLIYELVLGGDPDVYAYWHSSQDQREQRGLNFANYNNVVADDALVGGRSRHSSKQRSDSYQVFTKRWQSDAASLPLYRPTIEYIKLPFATAMSNGTKLVNSTDRYANVIYWSVRKDAVYKTP